MEYPFRVNACASADSINRTLTGRVPCAILSTTDPGRANVRFGRACRLEPDPNGVLTLLEIGDCRREESVNDEDDWIQRVLVSSGDLDALRAVAPMLMDPVRLVYEEKG